MFTAVIKEINLFILNYRRKCIDNDFSDIRYFNIVIRPVIKPDIRNRAAPVLRQFKRNGAASDALCGRVVRERH